MNLKLLIACALLVFPFTSGEAKDFRHNGNELTFEQLRIRLLSPTSFSLQTGDDFRFDPVRLDLGITDLPSETVDCRVERSGKGYRISTDAITIHYDPSRPLDNGGIRVEGIVQIADLAAPDTLNLGGVIGALDNCDGRRCYAEQNDITSESHLRPNPQNGILSRRGYTVLKHTPDALNQYHAGETFNELYVFCYGTNYRQALSDFFAVAGEIPMLPKWSLGLIYSRWKDYNDNDYKAIITGFRSRGIPLDAVILDMCWHVDDWYGYRYDTRNFPDMKGFLAWTEAQHIKTGFNHHSGCIYKDDPDVREFCRRAGLDYEQSIVDGPSFEPEIRVVQYDTRNERHFKAFYDLYLTRMIKDGFDFHWVDGANSIYSAELYDRYLREGTGLRPLVLNRQQDYTLCNHRYPAGFSGDTYATWATMRRTVEETIKGGNNGVWWSHDIGGYMPQGVDGYIPDGEMFARWAQLGAVSPLMRLHAKKDLFWYPVKSSPDGWDGGSRLPWEWGPTVMESIKASIRLRAALNPYIYTLMREAHDKGIPVCRGMYLDHAECDEAYRFDQFMFGDALLAAPAMQPSGNGQHGVTERSIWLPEGAWYDYFTRERLDGGRFVTRTSDIYTFPLYVRSGAVIPTTSVGDYVSKPLTDLTIQVYASTEEARTTFDLYEDQGENFDYEKGLSRRTRLIYDHSGNGLHRITVEAARGSYPEAVAERDCTIEVIGLENPSDVRINGAKAEGWSLRNGLLRIPCGTHAVTDTLNIEIR